MARRFWLVVVLACSGCGRWETCGPSPEWMVTVEPGSVVGGNADRIIVASPNKLTRYDLDGHVVATEVVGDAEPRNVTVDANGRVLVDSSLSVANHYTAQLTRDWSPEPASVLGAGGEVAFAGDSMFLWESDGTLRWSAPPSFTSTIVITDAGQVVASDRFSFARYAASDGAMTVEPAGPGSVLEADGDGVIVAFIDALHGRVSLERRDADWNTVWDAELDAIESSIVHAEVSGSSVVVEELEQFVDTSPVHLVSHDIRVDGMSGAVVSDRERCVGAGGEIVASDAMGYVVFDGATLMEFAWP